MLSYPIVSIISYAMLSYAILCYAIASHHINSYRIPWYHRPIQTMNKHDDVISITSDQHIQTQMQLDEASQEIVQGIREFRSLDRGGRADVQGSLQEVEGLEAGFGGAGGGDDDIPETTILLVIGK